MEGLGGAFSLDMLQADTRNHNRELDGSDTRQSFD
jgi:hypothetical protein